MEKISDDELQAQTPKFKEIRSPPLSKASRTRTNAAKRAGDPARAPARSFCDGARSVQNASPACGTSTCSSSAASRCIRAGSPRCGRVKVKRWLRRLPSYLNGLTGRGVHVVTVNDYLASRDAEWMGKIHRFLGLDGRLYPERHGRL